MTKLARQALFMLLITSGAAGATTVDQILARDGPPPGVVFEIVQWDKGFLEQALPRVRDDIERLRARFPGLDVAVVSHGSEQFSLMSTERQAFEDVHALTQSLVGDDVAVQVCGSHASYRGVSEDDFPDYVDVVPSAPARINDYLNLDYLLVMVR